MEPSLQFYCCTTMRLRVRRRLINENDPANEATEVNHERHSDATTS